MKQINVIRRDSALVGIFTKYNGDMYAKLCLKILDFLEEETVAVDLGGGIERGYPGRGSSCVIQLRVSGPTENWVPDLAPSFTSWVTISWTQLLISKMQIVRAALTGLCRAALSQTVALASYGYLNVN